MNARGFTLIELLIASALGALLVAGALGAYAQGRALYERSERLARLHETASYVFSALEPDVQLAGYLGFHDSRTQVHLPDALPASLQDCGPLALRIPIAASDQGYTLRCAANGGGAVPGADTLSVRRAQVEASPPERGRAQLFTARLSPAAQSLLLDGVVTIALKPGETEVRDLVMRNWYVAQRADGGGASPALRVKSLSAIAGTPAFIDTEVMSGIEDLQVQFGYVTEGEPLAALRYVDPGAVPTSTHILTARIWLRLRAEEPDAGYRDDRHYAYANQTFDAADHFQRLLVSRTIALRNEGP